MARENVDVVQRHTEAFNRRDLTTWLALFRSDAEIDWSRARGPQKGVYRGRRGHQAFWDVWLTFDWGEIETYDLAEAGSEVVVPNTTTFRGRQGIEVVARSAFVITVENSQITRYRLFQERAEALEAAGLSE
ncbi:MAG TPA: nuclear transport factor 2 family protein [Solirubrobacterales bacterium]|nr:nuclear transport factor 2 family protein [Solirubrobacterales bacterium]